MANTDLASKVLRLTSENLDLIKRLKAKTEIWRELGFGFAVKTHNDPL